MLSLYHQDDEAWEIHVIYDPHLLPKIFLGVRLLTTGAGGALHGGCPQSTGQLIMEEDMNQTEIVNHINYLIQIACCAQSKRWTSVLNYDTIYRREQH